MSDIASYGLVVEGPYDKAFYEALLPRICNTSLHIVTRVCDGVAKLMKLFPVFLSEFEHVRHGRPVDKALVIRDSQGAETSAPRTRMENSIRGRTYSFPREVQLCVVRRQIETWLLADGSAINQVTKSRGGREVSEVTGSLEDIRDPKARLRSLLIQARIEYSAAVCAEIASQVRIGTLEYRCPSFLDFKRKVLDC